MRNDPQNSSRVRDRSIADRGANAAIQTDAALDAMKCANARSGAAEGPSDPAARGWRSV